MVVSEIRLYELLKSKIGEKEAEVERRKLKYLFKFLMRKLKKNLNRKKVN